VWDVDPARTDAVAERVGGRVDVSREEALAADLLVTVTPGREILLPERSLRPGQHVSLMGADGPGKAEIAVAELARIHVFCDDWEQASHGGECAAAVEAGVLSREDVTEIGRVLTGEAEGRRDRGDITAFDSTGLALQDLAVALVALEHADELDLPTVDL
jgi:ornithine cyclodeaminase/alanine dehydrogenase-like protein (mu-crystallin family)